MRTLALILARAGSKGVPGKSTRMVAGRPCVCWTIDHALDARAAGAVGRIAVTTDSKEVQQIALGMGIDVVARPAGLATDTARVDDAARHAVPLLEQGERFDAIAVLYANVPVRPDGLLLAALSLMATTGADSVQSYAPVGKHHPWWTAVVEPASKGGAVRAWDGGVLNHGVFRRQDLPPAHIPDGGVLVVTRRALFGEIPGVDPGPHAFFGRDRRGVINPEGSVVDIDSEIDLVVADALLSGRAMIP